MKELTFEITNYCPEICKFCSSNITNNYKQAIFLEPEMVLKEIKQRIGIIGIQFKQPNSVTIQDELNLILSNYHSKYYLTDLLFDQIHISGGEPLSHPQFYIILQICRFFAKDVIVHTNALPHIVFNLHVLDTIYVEGYVTTTADVDKIHIAKRIEQGKELIRPEVHFSGNWTKNCDCNHDMVLPNGTIAKSPCRKEDIIRESIPNSDGIVIKEHGEEFIYTKYCPSCFHEKKEVHLSRADKGKPLEERLGRCLNCGDMYLFNQYLIELPSDVEQQRKKAQIRLELENQREELEEEIEDLDDEIDKFN